MSRSPYDGRPFYCTVCCAGWEEFGACEEPDCELETLEQALSRKVQHDARVAAAQPKDPPP